MALHSVMLFILLITPAQCKGTSKVLAEWSESKAVQELLVIVIIPGFTMLILFFILHCIISQRKWKIICWVIPRKKDLKLKSAVDHKSSEKIPSETKDIINKAKVAENPCIISIKTNV